MSTTQIALAAHLVMPQGHSGGDFRRAASAGLSAHFGIAHVTLQTETEPLQQPCQALPSGPPAG